MKDRIKTVLRVRELAERRALAKVAASEQQVRAAEAVVAERKQAYYARQQLGQPVGPVQLRALALQGIAAHDLVRDAISDRDLTIERRAELVRAWSLTSIQRKSVERLSEKRDLERVAIARSAADRALDEAVLLRRRAS
jgi:hypothetical protein